MGTCPILQTAAMVKNENDLKINTNIPNKINPMRQDGVIKNNVEKRKSSVRALSAEGVQLIQP